MKERSPKFPLVAGGAALCVLASGLVLAATSFADVARRAGDVLASLFAAAARPELPLLSVQRPQIEEVTAATMPISTAEQAHAPVSLVSTREVRTVSAADPLVAAPVARCRDALRLVSCVVDAADPSRSLAAIRMHGGTRLTPVGAVLGDLTLVAIQPSHAYFLRGDGSACHLSVFGAGHRAAQGTRTESTTHVPASPKRPALDLTELRAGIRQIGPDTYAIDRETVHKALGSVNALRRSGRFRMKQEEGRKVGLELVRMRGDSPLSQLGLRVGDVVRKLNGFDMASPDGALQAVQAVRSQGRFTLALVRNGAPHVLSYEVR